MDCQEVWAWVERYQSAIATILVGLLGFAGVIITLVANAKLTRHDRAEAIAHERAALTAALLAELKILKLSIEENIDTSKSDQEKEDVWLLVPTNPTTEAYDALLPRIGLLPPGQVEQLMSAYLSLKAYRDNLALLPGAQARDDHLVKIPKRSFESYQQMSMDMLARLNGAMDSLS